MALIPKWTKRKPKATNQDTRTCWKCGKVGHLANKCTTKKKLAELDIDEGLKLSLSKILLNTSPDQRPTEPSSEDNEIQEIGGSTPSSSSPSDHDQPCTSKCSKELSYWKAIASMNGLSINVLTSTQEDILAIIDKILDPELRRKLITLCIEQHQSTPMLPTSLPSQQYSIQEIYKHE